MDLHGQVGRIRMLNGIVALNVTAPTAIRCGSTELIDRKWLYIMNASGIPVFIGSEYLDTDGAPQTITKDKLARTGIKMASGDAIWLPVSDKLTVYGISQSGAGKRLRIMELA